jgi:hypothetical protein
MTNTPREDERGEYWPDKGIYVTFNVKKVFNWMRGKMKFLVSLLSLFILPYAWGADCFTPAHNMVGYSEDMTSATGWTKVATITDDSATTPPPAGIFNVGKTFKAVLAAGQSNIEYGVTSNIAFVVGNSYKLSMLAKYQDRQYIGMGIGGGGTWGCSYDIQNGVAGVCNGSLTTPTITAAGGGWYKLTALYVGHVTNPNVRFQLTNQTNVSTFTVLAATGGEIVYMSSPQVQNVTTPATSSLESSKYVPNLLFGISWAPAIDCNIRKW